MIWSVWLIITDPSLQGDVEPLKAPHALLQTVLMRQVISVSQLHSLCIEFLGCLFSICYLGFVTGFQIWGILGGVRPFFLIPFCCLCVTVLCYAVLRRRITR